MFSVVFGSASLRKLVLINKELSIYLFSQYKLLVNNNFEGASWYILIPLQAK